MALRLLCLISIRLLVLLGRAPASKEVELLVLGHELECCAARMGTSSGLGLPGLCSRRRRILR
ncbi:hypothetical protein QRX50_37005 [Amycolatopsis carbonis]|uniref:Uncharacterized protein n=1 Tax=Amycolatopsis carbonis TaxID=715471 RepID=A0A9Y2MQ92_9PSEU|nr:hypothetical protein [Amycolatopsis sp. 2-15]WIX76975.1 hypothetical protein QRX50_37005 [Amycolatopsis sp. 2-15]